MSDYEPERKWLVESESDAPDIHVLPTEDGHVARGHEPSLGCQSCRPVSVDGEVWGLSGRVWTHIEPSWPGASRGHLQ